MYILPRILAADGFVACAVILSLLLAPAANAFSPSSSHTRTGTVSSGLVATDAAAAAPCVTGSRWRSHSQSIWSRSMYIGDGKSKDEKSPDDGEDDSVMSSNRLSHVIMLISAPAQKNGLFLWPISFLFAFSYT